MLDISEWSLWDVWAGGAQEICQEDVGILIWVSVLKCWCSHQSSQLSFEYHTKEYFKNL